MLSHGFALAARPSADDDRHEMTTTMRRVRGWLLRFVRRRSVVIPVGVLMLVPAAWIHLGGAAVPAWFEGLSLVLGATGAALVWTGIVGARADWVE
jgi:hypothetical protein